MQIGLSLPSSTLDVQGFKLFFKLTWEPFEAQFSSIEARFSDHAITIVRLASVDFQVRVLEHQNQAVDLYQRQGEYYHHR